MAFENLGLGFTMVFYCVLAVFLIFATASVLQQTVGSHRNIGTFETRFQLFSVYTYDSGSQPNTAKTHLAEFSSPNTGL